MPKSSAASESELSMSIDSAVRSCVGRATTGTWLTSSLSSTLATSSPPSSHKSTSQLDELDLLELELSPLASSTGLLNLAEVPLNRSLTLSESELLGLGAYLWMQRGGRRDALGVQFKEGSIVDRIKIRVISLTLALSRDPNEIVEIQIFVSRIRDQPRMRLIRLSKVKGKTFTDGLAKLEESSETRPAYLPHLAKFFKGRGQPSSKNALDSSREVTNELLLGASTPYQSQDRRMYLSSISLPLFYKPLPHNRLEKKLLDCGQQKKLLPLFLSKLDLPPTSPPNPPPPATSPPPANSSPPPIALAVVPSLPATLAPSISSTKGHNAVVDSSAMNLSFDDGDGGYVDLYVAGADDVFTAELIGNDGFVESNGPILSPLAEMEVEEEFALREWRSDGIGVLR
ncbi:Clathrin light chain like [Actinidia chinensis var. chinensis]|uniref:Clathrin light chain like n=1 Tax=Actinidia chinensis var. chinensis TaxID=1590841 RepID=A0A2R6QIC2_ACTCC|nr:Clathrin light chain like [Actinidia chinensis var. chinensis]